MQEQPKQPTQELYGMNQTMLSAYLGKAMVGAEYLARIVILKANLQTIIDKDPASPLIKNITDAIDFYQRLHNELNTLN